MVRRGKKGRKVDGLSPKEVNATLFQLGRMTDAVSVPEEAMLSALPTMMQTPKQLW
jgi:hypothetical protein